MKIVSLLPSATEFVCELGLGDELVGVTHECDYPAYVTRLPKVTRTLIPQDASSREIDALVRDRLKKQRALYTLDMPILERLQPDVIVTQALCEVCRRGRDRGCRSGLHTSQPAEGRESGADLPGRCSKWPAVGSSGGWSGIRGDVAVHRLRRRIHAVAGRSRFVTTRPRVVLLEWIDPAFCCGHWSPELVRIAGGQEVIGRPGQPSRTLRWEEVVAARPEVLMIACCGFSVERTMADLPILLDQPGWDDLPALQSGRVFVVDGSAYFSRPGPRLVDSLEILANALHSNVHPLPASLPAAYRHQ